MPRFDRALCLFYARRAARIQGQFALSTSAVAVFWSAPSATRKVADPQVANGVTDARCVRASMGEIDETVLPNLTAEDLKDLGVGIVGHRRKLLDAIAALRHRRERERALAA